MSPARMGWLVVLWCSGCDCYSSSQPGDDGGIRDGDAAVPPRRDGGPIDAGRDDAATDASGPDAALVLDGGDVDSGADAGAGVDGGVVVEAEAIQLDQGISFGPQVAMDRDDNATVAWFGGLGVVAKRWESGAWMETEVLGSGDDVRVDFNAGGQGVATWRDRVGQATAASLFEPGVGWLPQGAIGPGGNGSTGEVAIDGGGDVVALFDWSYSDDHRVQTVRYEPATGWSEASLLEPWDVNTRMPDVEANEAGDFAGVWTHLVVDAETIWASREAGRWEPPVQLSDAEGTFYPQVTLDGAGNGLIVWGQNDGNAYSIMASWQPEGGGFAEPEVVGPFDGGLILSASTAFDGTTFVGWVGGSDARVARRDPFGGWEPAESFDLLGAGSSVDAVAVAADEGGGAIVAWAQGEAGLYHVFWSRYVGDDGWTDGIEVLPAFGGEARALSIAAAPDGTAVVAWEVWDGVSFHVWATVLLP